MATLHAPFNFVPLNKEIYSPEWANKISQDIPFRDGVSGIIELSIKAMSPLFIKNGESQDEENVGGIREFSHTNDGKYFIPATSLKGAIRNVLEIITFGKLTQYQDQSFGIRDLSNGSDGIFYRTIIQPANIHCGWLKKSGNGYIVKDCGIPYRISADEIDTRFGHNFKDFIEGKIRNRPLKEDENRTAKAKYDLLEGCNLVASFSEDYNHNDNKPSIDNRKFVKFGSDFRGRLVLTGQSSARKKRDNGKWIGKYYEFVFPEKIENEKKVDRDLFKRFETIHKNSPDYKDYFKEKLYRGEEIPVFFCYDENHEIEGFGLAYMFKYPAFYSIKAGIPEKIKSTEKLDLQECIFGFTSDNKESLKGRVQFSNAFLDGNPQFEDPAETAMSTPHPSYYPLYLGNGQTWNNPTPIQLAGRKRYPVRNTPMTNQGTDAMTFSIRPLSSGSEFKGVIRFHNLLPIELGALMNSINFWNDGNIYYHSLGECKPLGYGKVLMKAVITELQYNSNEQNGTSSFEEIFQEEMRKSFNGWDTCEQITELKRMAMGIPEDREQEFTYMHMDTDSDKNEFKKGKEAYNTGEQLGKFSEIIDKKVPHSSAVKSMDPQMWERKKKEEARKRKEEEATRIKKEELETRINELREGSKFGEIKNILNNKDDASLIEKGRKEELWNEVMDAETKTDALETEAKDLFNNQLWKESKDKYEEARACGIKDFKNEIAVCESKINEKSGDITDFLRSLPFNPQAFANRLRPRYKDDKKPEDEISDIAEYIKTKLASESKDTKKQWESKGKWNSFKNVLGEENAKALYFQIFSKPL